MESVNASGRAFLSHTRLRGRFVMRVAIASLRTSDEDLEIVWQLLRDEAADTLRRRNRAEWQRRPLRDVFGPPDPEMSRVAPRGDGPGAAMPRRYDARVNVLRLQLAGSIVAGVATHIVIVAAAVCCSSTRSG